MAHSVGLYVHVPFCTAKCHYCDFNSYAGLDRLFGRYVEGTCREIERLPEGLEAGTVFFGGGTPSLLDPADLGRILGTIRSHFEVPNGAEITVEANPGTVAESRLTAIRALGVNRVSFGVQSFDARLLGELGRIHTAEQATAACYAARRAGFESINLDFIYGLPNQTLAVWRDTLQQALRLQPEHISLYALTVEPGTLFFRRAERGQLLLPDEDLVADMYELADELLAATSYRQYEISNWALESRYRCQHNLRYWRNLDYLGVGPGAHSWFGGRRYVGVLSPVQWAERIERGESPMHQEDTIAPALALGETVMLGLRLNDGVDLAELSARFDVDAPALFREPIAETTALGLVEAVDGRLRLTKQARLLGNEVFRRFLLAAERLAA